MDVPLDIIAIASAVFHHRLPTGARRNPKIDYVGMTALAVAVTCLVLFTTWGGNTYDWNSPTIVGAFTESLAPIFRYLVPLVLIAAVLLAFVQE